MKAALVIIMLAALCGSALAEEQQVVAFNFDMGFSLGMTENVYVPVVPDYLLLAGTADNLTTPAGDQLTTPQ
jgi:hypothetical protein